MVECNLNLARGVPAIKALRSALGLGLREAKEMHDSIRDVGGTKRIRCNFAQLGALIAYGAEQNGDVWITHISVLSPFDGLDLTK